MLGFLRVGWEKGEGWRRPINQKIYIVVLVLPCSSCVTLLKSLNTTRACFLVWKSREDQIVSKGQGLHCWLRFYGSAVNYLTRFRVLDVVLMYTDEMLIFYFETERIFEDHENLVENLLNWTRDSQNKLIFMERIEKYALFKNPQVRLNNL